MTVRGTAFHLLLAAATLSACVVGPQPLPPDDPFCGGPEEILFEVVGSGRITGSGTWSGDAVGFEVVNLDSDGPPLFVDIDELNRFSFEIAAAPTDRLRVQGAGGSCSSAAEPWDYHIDTGELLAAPARCLSAPRMVTCRLAGEGEASCEASWRAHNLCEGSLTLSSASPREATSDISLQAALPLTIAASELATLAFTVGAGERISQVFFIEIEGAEEATLAVTVRLEPFR